MEQIVALDNRPAYCRCRLCSLCYSRCWEWWRGRYWITYFPAVVVLGLGMAISVAPLTTTVLGAVDKQYVGTASGVNNAISRTAGLIAIAVFGIIVLGIFSNNLTSQLPLLHIPAAIQHSILLQQNKLVGIEIPAGLSRSTHTAVQHTISESFIASFRVIMLLAAGLAIGSSVAALLFIEDKRQDIDKKI